MKENIDRSSTVTMGSAVGHFRLGQEISVLGCPNIWVYWPVLKWFIPGFVKRKVYSKWEKKQPVAKVVSIDVESGTLTLDSTIEDTTKCFKTRDKKWLA